MPIDYEIEFICRYRGILLFLWQHKLATTAMLYERYMSEIKPRTAYNYLMMLQKKKLIIKRTDEYGNDPLWMLTKLGLEEISLNLPELEQKYLKSECRRHDLICTSAILGDFIKKIPKDLEIITEQVLRSCFREQWPDCIPNPKEHRPDGYWIFNNDNPLNLMALEVELSQKKKARYEDYKYFYEQFPQDQKCLWIVKSKSLASTIIRCLYPTRPDYYIHNFVLLKDFLDKGWQANIFLGPNKHVTIHNLICTHLQYIDSNSTVPMFTNYLKDTRLTYGIH